VHGDIKPENVLVFRLESGDYSARVIDFGYSTRYAHDAQQLELPRSKPWNAPENEGLVHTWTPAEAVKSDLFCLGMVYFWLLFEPYLRVMARSGQDERTEEVLHQVKQELPKFVSKFLRMASISDHGLETILLRVFQSVLAYDPHVREAERVEEFLKAMNPQRCV
jgi:serine/threonine protein kinase